MKTKRHLTIVPSEDELIRSGMEAVVEGMIAEGKLIVDPDDPEHIWAAEYAPEHLRNAGAS